MSDIPPENNFNNLQNVAVEITSPADEGKTFSEQHIRSYPRSNRKVAIQVTPFGLRSDPDRSHDGVSLFISPAGIEFQASKEFKQGSLLRIEISIPDYWERKMRIVEYRRIDRPENFRILAKVIKIEDIGKRGKKKHVIAQTVNLEPCDEKVLRQYLEEG
jgi:hypothetical protein